MTQAQFMRWWTRIQGHIHSGLGNREMWYAWLNERLAMLDPFVENGSED